MSTQLTTYEEVLGSERAKWSNILILTQYICAIENDETNDVDKSIRKKR